MAELFPQETVASFSISAFSVEFPSLIRADGVRRGPVQPTTEAAPPADWARSPLYCAPEEIQ